MYLLIDTISIPATYVLFDSKRDIVSKEHISLRWSESELFLSSLLEFLERHSLSYESLQGVVVVNGPGSFTAMRIVTLTINTLSFIHHVPLYSIDYFQLLELADSPFPMIIRANRGEYLRKETHLSAPLLITIPDMPAGNYSGIGDVNDFTNAPISIQSNLRYEVFCKNIPFEHPTERIDPFYIKKPNIT